MNAAVKLCLLASGVYFMAGLLTGVIKYRSVMTSPSRRAPVYVDIAHRAALMYSFASLVLAKLVEYSPYPTAVQVAAAAAPLAFFGITIAGYLYFGIGGRTDNIFRRSDPALAWFMYLLITAEVGGFAVILWGFLDSQLIN